jgi:hypothetical protein
MWKETTLGCLTRGNYLTIILAGIRNTAEKSVRITVFQELPEGGSTELRRFGEFFFLVARLLLSGVLIVFCDIGDFEVIYGTHF